MANKKRAGTRGPGTSKRSQAQKGLKWLVVDMNDIISRHNTEKEANAEARGKIFRQVRQETEAERNRRLAAAS